VVRDRKILRAEHGAGIKTVLLLQLSVRPSSSLENFSFPFVNGFSLEREKL
jgi:hypothetical protein